MDAVQIGSLYLNWSLFTFMVAVAIGYAAIVFSLRKATNQQAVKDIVLNSMILGIFVWKLSPALFEPSMIWSSPFKVLMIQGGMRELVLGSTVAVLYLLYRSFKSNIRLELLTDVIAVGGAMFGFTQAVVGGWRFGNATSLPWGISLVDPTYAYHPLNVYEAIAALLIMAWIRLRHPHLGSGKAGGIGFIYGGFGIFMISLFDNQLIQPQLFLSAIQWIAIVAVILGLILPQLHILWAAIQERSHAIMDENMSKAQQEHERENEEAAERAAKNGTLDDIIVDKKLDGPNRPAE
jgi:uncharacterized membrane-anchored protein YhcB (DUF1043 family)